MNECNIVKDLMPLYADNLLSTDSTEFIHRHIAWCESCRETLRRSGQELPELSTDAYISEKKALKKAIRRDRRRTVVRTLLTIALILSMFACYIGFTLYEWGYLTPIESTYPAPDGSRTLELVERDFIGCRSNGYMIRFRWEEEGWLNRYYTDWDTMEVHWADDSRHLFLDVITVAGEHQLLVIDSEKQMSQGGTWDIPGLESLYPQIVTAAEAHMDQSVDTISFAAWEGDCQTIVLCVTTVDGTQHPIRYHYPSNSIVP